MFKELKPARGIFAVRCAATGQVWIGSSPNLQAWRNSLWFSLRSGGSPNKTLQREWDARGEAAFSYEILETLDDEVPALLLGDVLKEKKLGWIAKLSAEGLL